MATGDVQQSHVAHLKKQLSADFSKKLDMFKQQTASPVTNKVCFNVGLHIEAQLSPCHPLIKHVLITPQLLFGKQSVNIGDQYCTKPEHKSIFVMASRSTPKRNSFGVG